VRVLREGPLAIHGLQGALKIPARPFGTISGFWKDGGWVETAGTLAKWKLLDAERDIRLAKCLLKLL
jgi:hypothetical protein